MRSDRPTLSFWNQCSDSAELVLRHRMPTQENPAAVAQIRALIDGAEIGVLEAGPGRSRSRLELPPKKAPRTATGIATDVNELELQFQPDTTADGKEENPFRLLGLRLICGASTQKMPVPGSFSLGSTRRNLKLFQPGSFVLPLRLPERAREIRLQARLLGHGETHLRVLALRDEPDRIEPDRITLASFDVGKEGWQDLAVPIEDVAGAAISLLLEVDAPAETATTETGATKTAVTEPAAVEIRNLELISAGKDDASDDTDDGDPEPSLNAAASRPDVILIILDAARGDRFPGAGYHRQTVPNITALAEDALVFRNAYSECPTTSCSIPALITGISFLPGGKVRGGRQLSPEVTTLAEYLGQLGYRTVSLSATPNHSTAHNLHQGYDEFRQLWNKRLPQYGPENMSRLADEILRSQPTDEPLLLQLHYKPPHWPYKPGAEFDRFTDPSYDGPVDLGTSLRYYTQRVEMISDRDLEQMIGLYDGNLLRADAAVGMVIESLRQTNRWKSSLVVITSDHGEAFLEHGRLGHNSTLFEEMIHVPLVIRLPGGERPEQVDPDRLASLLDVVPTILGQMGASPSSALDGVDLIHSPQSSRRPRVLFFHLLNNQLLGARTPRWKSIASPRGEKQMLFRVDEDPDELRNLVVEHPLAFADLGLQIRNHLQATRSRGFSGEAVEITPEAEEALRALGYIN